MYRIKIKRNDKWVVIDKFLDTDYRSAVDAYNGCPTPKMLVGSLGIIHKQYTDNGFQYTGGKLAK